MHRGWIHRRICSLRVTHLQGRKLKRPVTKFRHQTVFSYAYHARANRDFYRCEEDMLSEEPLCFWTFYPTVLVLGPIYVNFASREENIPFDIILKAIEQKTLDKETKTTTAKKKAQKYFQWHSKCHRSLMSILLMRSANGLLKNHKMSQFFFSVNMNTMLYTFSVIYWSSKRIYVTKIFIDHYSTVAFSTLDLFLITPQITRNFFFLLMLLLYDHSN